jgi:ATP-dependent Lon protease
MPGSDEQFILTGQLGDVMRESARIGLSYVESHLEELGLSKEKGGARFTFTCLPAQCPRTALRRVLRW